jgi:two-component system, NarL family, invasion response regulator UvrY
VLVVDDNDAVSRALSRLLQSHPGIRVVAVARTGAEAAALVVELRPEVTLLDISMPGQSGLSAVARLKHLHPDGRVVMCSLHDEPAFARAALREGADGYVVKDNPGGLFDAIGA